MSRSCSWWPRPVSRPRRRPRFLVAFALGAGAGAGAAAAGAGAGAALAFAFALGAGFAFTFFFLVSCFAMVLVSGRAWYTPGPGTFTEGPRSLDTDRTPR